MYRIAYKTSNLEGWVQFPVGVPKMSKDKYTYEEIQEKYKDNELFHNLEDAQMAICNIMDLLLMGDYELAG